MATNKQLLQAIAIASKRLDKLNLIDAFDGRKPESRPTASQQEFFDDLSTWQYSAYAVLGGNQSGKSQCIRKVIALLLEEHPDSPIKRKESWEGPLQILLVGKNYKQIEESIWRGVMSFFREEEIHVTKNGNVLYKATHRVTGNTVIFFSHENPGQCRERVQSFTAHVAICDEMPVGHNAFKLLEELQRRVMINGGAFILPCTPKSINREVKAMVEAWKPPNGKKYILKSLDNPGMSEESKTNFITSLETLPESYRKCIMEGAWMTADNAVYFFDDDRMILPLPPTYFAGWRHVVCIDPGLDSATGLVVAAEDPASGFWYTVRAEYIKGIYVVADLVQEIRSRVNGLNVTKYVADGASTWFIHTANQMGMHCSTPYDKNNRREEMMKNLQTGLGTKLFITPWCIDLIDEFKSMQWSETVEGKVQSSSRFHTADAIRYLWDCIPKFEGSKLVWTDAHTALREANKKRKEIEALEAKLRSRAGGHVAKPMKVRRR